MRLRRNWCCGPHWPPCIPSLILHLLAQGDENLFIHIMRNAIDDVLIELRLFNKRLRKLIRSIDTHQKQHYLSFKNIPLISMEAIFGY